MELHGRITKKHGLRFTASIALSIALIGAFTVGTISALEVRTAAMKSARVKALDPKEADLYKNYVQPILNKHCTSCHGEKKAKGKLRLHTFADIMKGADAEPIIVAGKPDESTIIERILLPDDDEDRMPPPDDDKERLPDQKAAVLKWWVELGAKNELKISTIASVPAEMQKALDALKPVDTAALEAAKKAKAELAKKQAGMISEIGKKLGVLILPTYQGSTELDLNALNVADKFGDDQLKELGPVASAVVNLNLARTKVTDAGLEAVGTMSNLKVLHLEKTKINGSGLDHIAKLKDLEYLNLYGTEVNDDTVQKLGTLANLKKLYLFESKVTKAGADKLKQQLKDVDVNLGFELAKPEPKKEEPKKEEPKKEATAPKPKPDEIKTSFVKLAKLFDDGSCCHKAHGKDEVCKHNCCIKAAKLNKVCLKCNPGAKDKKP